MHYVSEKDIRKARSVSCIEVPCPDLKALDRGKPGEDKSYLKAKVGSFWNDSKDTPSFLFRLAAGDVVFLEDSQDFKKFLLNSRPKADLSGLFVLIRETPGSPMFMLSRSAGPGQVSNT